MNGETLTISVALTTCNGCPYVESQLDSIALQTRRPDEIVIGDDQSSDDTEGAVRRFAARHGIPTHWQCNATRLGFARNFEQVVARCSGDIIAFADHDDIWLPQKLARLETALAADPDASFAFSDGLLIDERGLAMPGTVFSGLAFDPAQRAAFAAGGALDILVKHNVVLGATLAVRRAAVLPLLPFEPGWAHDYYLALMLSVLGRGILLDEPLIHYRRHQSQQIGVADARWKTLVALARRQSATQSRLESENFARLRPRLLELGVSPERAILDALDGKARYLAVREGMRARRSHAPRLIWKALREGAYRQYALGWKQLVLDLVALGVGPGPTGL